MQVGACEERCVAGFIGGGLQSLNTCIDGASSFCVDCAIVTKRDQVINEH